MQYARVSIGIKEKKTKVVSLLFHEAHLQLLSVYLRVYDIYSE